MPISQAGSINTTALLVPDVYVQIVPPAQQFLNGVPTNILGIVGTATWGPVNSPVVAGSVAQAAAVFGPLQARKYDLGTHVATASLQGANNFRLVRVTDGTDGAAGITILTNCLTVTSKYTGTFGNGITVTISAGSAVGTQKVVIGAPGLISESFDNIGLGLSGNALWVAIAAAINAGTTSLRGPSNIVVASAGVGTTAPAVATYSLTSGTDGVAGVTGTTLVGVDTVPRAGMYALRNTGTSVGILADCDASTTWAAQVAYGLFEGTEMILVGPSGDTIANATSTKASAGIDSYAAKLMFGDWIYWLDTYNNGLRVVSPQGFIGGLLANLSPQESALNDKLYGIVGTQKSYASQVYTEADLQLLAAAGIEVIANPSPGGQYFSARLGQNSSSNPLTNDDSYTRMTNYIAATLNAGMGIFIGETQTVNLWQDAAATLSAFFQNLWDQQMIGNPQGTVPYSVEIDSKNNPPSRVALGYLQADVKVQYLSIVKKFIINLQGGASVTITSTAPQLA